MVNFVCVLFLDIIFVIDLLKVSKGFLFVVVMEDGKVGLRLVGIVISWDVDFVCDWSI